MFRDVDVGIIEIPVDTEARKAHLARIKHEHEEYLRNNYMTLRPSQQENFNAYWSSQFHITNAGVGYGKSLFAKTKACSMIKDGLVKGSLYIVPKVSIGKGFKDMNVMVGQNHFHYELGENQFLIGSTRLPRPLHESLKLWFNRIKRNNATKTKYQHCVISTPTFIKFYDELNDEDKDYFINNILINVDEAHHLSTNEHTELNKISNAINDIIERNGYVHLLTATFFRNDKSQLLTQAHRKLFTSYHMSLADHIVQNTEIEKIELGFYFYDPNDFTKPYEAYKFDEPTIFFANHTLSNDIKFVGSGDAWIGKERFANNIIDVANKLGRTYYDLISEENYSHRQEIIRDMHAQSLNVDIIASMNMFREGSDYPELTNAFIQGAPNLGTAIQAFGRLARNVQGKKVIRFFIGLPNNYKTNKSEFKQEVNKYVDALVTLFAMKEVIEPQINPFPTSNSNSSPQLPRVTISSVLDKAGVVDKEQELKNIMSDVVLKTCLVSDDDEADSEITKVLSSNQHIKAANLTANEFDKLVKSVRKSISPKIRFDKINGSDQNYHVDLTESINSGMRYLIGSLTKDELSQIRNMIEPFASDSEVYTWCQNNGVTTRTAYEKANKPPNFPSPRPMYDNPEAWPLTTSIWSRTVFASDSEVHAWCQNNGVTTSMGYVKANKPDNFPTSTTMYMNPEAWPLTTSIWSKPVFASDSEVYTWCQNNGVTTRTAYEKANKPDNFPSTGTMYDNPEAWPLTTSIWSRTVFASDSEIYTWCQNNGVTTRTAYEKANKPDNFPAPGTMYNNQEDWPLTTSIWSKPVFASDSEVYTWCQNNGVTTRTAYEKANKPPNFPSPRPMYRNPEAWPLTISIWRKK